MVTSTPPLTLVQHGQKEQVLDHVIGDQLHPLPTVQN